MGKSLIWDGEKAVEKKEEERVLVWDGKRAVPVKKKGGGAYSDIGGQASATMQKAGMALSGKTPSKSSSVATLKERTPEQRLKDIGLNVTFDPASILEANKPIDFSNGQGFTEAILKAQRPNFVNLNDENSLSDFSKQLEEKIKEKEAYLNTPKGFGVAQSPEYVKKAQKDLEEARLLKAQISPDIQMAAAKNAANKILSQKNVTDANRVDLQSVGLSFLKQTNPSMYKRANYLLSKGKELGEEFTYNIEKAGLDILSSLNQSSNRDIYSVTEHFKNLNIEIEDAHPKYNLSKAWDIVSGYNHTKDNRANNGLWRNQPSYGQVRKWLEEDELKERFAGNETAYRELKNYFNTIPESEDGKTVTDVSVGGFLNNTAKSVFGAFEDMGNIFRSDTKRMQSMLNPTMGRGTFTGNYKNPGESTALQQRFEYLNSKEKQSALSSKEGEELSALKKTVKARDGFDKTLDMMGEGMGQVISTILPAKALGAGFKGIGLVKNAMTADQLGMNLTAAIQSFDGARQQAVYNFPDDELKQGIYTGTMVAANVISERMFNDVKAADSFKKAVMGDVKNTLKDLSVENINKGIIRNNLQSTLKKFAVNAGIDTNKNALEEVAVQVVDEALQSGFGAEDYDISKAIERVGDAYVSSLISFAPVGALSGYANTKMDKFNKTGIYNAALSPEKYLNQIKEDELNGELTDVEADEKRMVLSKAAELVKDEPPKVKVQGTSRRAAYLVNRLNIALKQEELKNTTDANLQKDLKDEIKQSEEVAEKIYNGDDFDEINTELSADADMDLEEMPSMETAPLVSGVEGGDVETKQQIENFGVPKEDVDATHSLISQVFDGIKKAGLTTAKTVGDWVGIGKGGEKPYSLKIGDKELQVKNTQPEVINGFYSPLEKVITDSKFDKLPAKQWAEKYANSEEAKWTGLKDWLAQQQGSVSKADIQQFLKDNRIQVVEVVKGEYHGSNLKWGSPRQGGNRNIVVYDGINGNNLSIIHDKANEVVRIENSEGDVVYDGDYSTPQEAMDFANENARQFAGDTKFSQYQLEGQKENYKEVLVTLPSKEIKGDAYHIVRDKYLIPALEKVGLNNSEDALRRMKNYADQGRSEEFKNDPDYVKATEALKALKDGGFNDVIDKYYSGFEFNKQLEQQRKNTFKSSHFDEPNILVHLRMNTRTDAEGKKVLFLEEVQSDWGQKGKKDGFDNKQLENERRQLLDEKRSLERKEEENTVRTKVANTGHYSDYKLSYKDEKLRYEIADKQKQIDERITQINNKTGIVAEAPFVTDTNSWTKLALKTALKEAVKQGADKIAWTTGEQQNSRYDLSQHVDEVVYDRMENGGTLIAYKDGAMVMDEKQVAPEKLADYIGKEAAEKILKGDGLTKEEERRLNYLKEATAAREIIPSPATKAEIKRLEDKKSGLAERGELKGEQLQVGGKGMIGFYGSPNTKIKGDEVYSLAVKNTSENNEALEDYKKQIISNEYSVIKLPISELIKSDKDLAEFIKHEEVSKGRKIDSPIIIGEKINDMSPNVKDGVIDGWHRIAQALANGEKDIDAYVPTTSKYYKENKLGIVGNVAKSLFKQEPKTTNIRIGKYDIGEANYVGGIGVYDLKGDLVKEFDTLKEAKDFIHKNESSTQHSIDITPEMKAEVEGKGQPLFKIGESKEEFGGFETRDGKPIGFTYDTEKVARERFNISKLKKIGSGSDRDVYDLGNGKVLKVAKTARGLTQNIYEGDNYLTSVVPEVTERGLNYVIAENTPRIKASDIVETFDWDGNVIGKSTAGEMLKELQKFSQRDMNNHDGKLQDVLAKYGLQDIMSYEVLWNDFTAQRNWGYKDGKAYHSDGGTFGGVDMIDSHKGKTNLSDPEFRKIYEESKRLKKQFGDTDKATMYSKDKGEIQAQYRIESGKNIIEAIKDFNQSKNKARATVALTHEIMHPTVVAIIDGAKEGNEVGKKHTQTIVNEFNKANPSNKVTVEYLIKGNDEFKNGNTSKQYRAVQEFIADSWEKYHTEGGKGFSDAFQKVLDQITQAFKAVYKSITGKQLTPELKQMFDDILGKEQSTKVEEQGGKSTLSENTLVNSNQSWRSPSGKYMIEYDENNNRILKDEKGDIVPEYIKKQVIVKSGKQKGLVKEVQVKNPAWRRQMLAHAKEYNYNFGDKAPSEQIPNFKDELEAASWVIENSNNPSEIAQTYLSIERQPIALSSVEAAIARNGVGKVTETSFRQFNDKNNINFTIAKNYFSKDGKSLDQVAQEASNYDEEVLVTPEDVAQFMIDFPFGVDPDGTVKTEAHKQAEEKFLKLTGIHLDPGNGSKTIATIAASQNLTAKDISQADEISEEEFDGLPEEEKLRWLQEMADEIEFLNNKNNDNEFNEEETGEVRTGEPTSESDNGQTAERATGEGAGRGGGNEGGGESGGVEEGEEGEVRKKSVLNKAHKAVMSTLELKTAIEGYGLDYKVQHFQDAVSTAEQIINDIGLDNAVNAIERGVIGGAESTVILAKANDALAMQMVQAIESGDTKRESELKDIEARLLNKMDSIMRDAGRQLSILQWVYENSDFGYDLDFNVNAYKKLNGGVIPDHILAKYKKNNEDYQKLKVELSEADRKRKEAEEKAAILEIELSIEREKKSGRPSNKDIAKKIATQIRKGKLSRPGLFMSNTPASIVWDGAVELTAKTIEAGGVIADAIQAGIDYIKKSEWYKSLSDDKKEQSVAGFTEWVNENSEVQPLKAEVIDGKIKIPHSLLRELVGAGIKDVNDLTTAIKNQLSEEYPDLTDRQVRDAITGYGERVGKSKDEIDSKIRELKNIGRAVSGLEDIAKGKRPLRSGLQRDKPTPDERRWNNILRDALKDLPPDDATTEKMLKTALDGIKTRLRNAIEDFTKALETNTPIERNNNTVEYDDIAKGLKDVLDDLKEDYKEKFGKGLTDEQKISRIETGLANAIIKAEEKLKSGNIGFNSKGEPLSSDKIKERREKLKLLNEQLKKLRDEAGILEERRLASIKTRLRNAIEDLEKRLRDKDYSKKVRKPLIEDDEYRAILARKMELLDRYEIEREKLRLSERSLGKKIFDTTTDILSLTRATNATGEFSPVFIQMGIFTLRNPIRALSTLGKMTTKALSQEMYDRWEGYLRTHPLYAEMLQSGLQIPRFNAKVQARAEGVFGDFGQNIVGVPMTVTKVIGKGLDKAKAPKWMVKLTGGDKPILAEGEKNIAMSFWKGAREGANPLAGFDRATTFYIGQMMMLRYQDLSKKLKSEGKTIQSHPKDYKNIANFVNTFSGKGSLAGIEKSEGATRIINSLFYSARNWSSILQQTVPLLTAYKFLKYNDSDGMFRKGSIVPHFSVAQKAMVRDYLTFLTTTAGIVMAVSLLRDDDDEESPKVSFDPRSTDFMKVKIGDTRIDPFGGRQQMVVFQTRMYLDMFTEMKSYVDGRGVEKRLGDGMYTPTQKALIINMLTNKAAPTFSLFIKSASTEWRDIKGDGTKEKARTDPFGNEYNFSKNLRDAFRPLFWQTIEENHKHHDGLNAAIFDALAAFGINVNTYESKKKK